MSEKLDEMGKDLGEMIAEINNASSALNKNSKADDPVSSITIIGENENVLANSKLKQNSYLKSSEYSIVISSNCKRSIKVLQHCKQKYLPHRGTVRACDSPLDSMDRQARQPTDFIDRT